MPSTKGTGVLKKLYDFTLHLAEHPKAIWALFFVALIESVIFPIPPDVMLIAMVLAVPGLAWRYASVCTIGSVVGGITAYFIGRYFFNDIAEPLFSIPCAHSEKYCVDVFMPLVKTQFEQWGVWLVAMSSVSILPYKLVTVTSGAVEMNLVAFTMTSLVGRGLRFFLVAALLKRFGEPIKHFIEKHLVWVFTGCCVVLALIITLYWGLA